MGSKSKKKPLTITRAQKNKIVNDATWDAIVMFVAVCMDEFDWTEDDIEAFAVRLDRYAGAVNEHLLTINKVKDIIKETIGVTIR